MGRGRTGLSRQKTRPHPIGDIQHMRVGLVYGFWGQNIGNAFFNLGGKISLELAGFEVYPIQDHPAYWTFRGEHHGNYERAYSVIESLDVDIIVAQGPLFTRNFLNIWGQALKSLRQRKVDWAVLSGAFRHYSSEERAVAKEAIELHRPRFISTRDNATADALRDVFPNVRAGIDSAFMCPLEYRPPELCTSPYIAACFDHYPEPNFHYDPLGPVEIGENTYSLEFPRRALRLARRSKAHAYVGQFLDRRQLPHQIGQYRIVRPEHRTNPHIPQKIYRRPNGIASDEPWTYLTVYSQAALTLSDRVHACVATLAYGGTAHLYNPSTQRSQLFDSVGAGDITKRPVTLQPNLIETASSQLTNFLSEAA